MKISRTVTIDLEDLMKINSRIENGEFEGVSDFVQQAIKKHLKE
jgi:Arc/MetJ-type ribon-helix-helix transcriptional regulator